MVWFKEVLVVDENGEITYLEDESRQWERKGEWYGYEGNEDGSYEYVHILLMLKRMWKHELCVECLTTMACAILAQALFWVPGTQAD